MIRTYTTALLLLLFSIHGISQDYTSTTQLAGKLQQLDNRYGDLTQLKSLTKTAGGNDVWVLVIGKENNPAIAVVGGVEGKHLLGTELAVGFAEKLLAASSTDSIKSLLETTSFFVFPNMSPDATSQYFASLKYGRSGNATDTDDDRDGRLNEDPFNDLNKDGKITMMRIKDPVGEYTTHPADDRVVIKAKDGENGNYIYLSEGIDDDKDKSFNEDGAGGIHFNKSFTFNFPYFEPGAGEHPVSENENRALLNFLYDHFNVFAVMTFGPVNNLSEPEKYQKAEAEKRVVSSWLEHDVKVNKFISDIYHQHVKNAKEAEKSNSGKGDFAAWAYYHYGRLSFSTPGWWLPGFELPKDSVEAAKFKKNEDKNKQVDYLRWAEDKDEDVFVSWEKIEHPDFPGKEVEVGGFEPFALMNPPYSLVDSLQELHTNFLVKLADLRPALEILNLKQESLGKGLVRVTLDVHNKGKLPTLSELGHQNQWVKFVKATISIANGQELISGNTVQMLPRLSGDGNHTLTWLIKGKGDVKVTVGSPQTGNQSIEVSVK